LGDEYVPAMNATTKAPPLLALKGVSKRFGPLEALTGVDFEVDAGEVVALVGDNGAGKSTLIKAIAGVQLCDEGTFSMRGKQVTISSPKDADALGITTVYQDLALCDNLDIVANLYLGHERFVESAARFSGYIDEIEMEKSSLKLLESLAVTTITDVRAHVASLSGGQRQAVAITRSLLGEPSVVLLDEPTAALGVVQTKQVLTLIRTLRERGLGVVIISHNLANVFDVADRIVVLRLGGRVATFDVQGVSHEDVVAAITGAESGAAPSELKERT
jgi:D-xylose transport system ATP-binding protein